MQVIIAKMQIMNWDSIKIFQAIALSGTLSGASKSLGVNHSTVFRRLNSFEKEIGGRLFERLGSGYELTTLGEEMLVYANRIAKSFDDLDRRLVGQDLQPRGIVKITAPNNIAYHYLPGYFARFNQHYPDIQFELLVSNAEFNLTNRQADIAVRATPAPPEHLVGRQVGTLKWGVYTGRDRAEIPDQPDILEHLAHHPLIGASGFMRGLPGFVWLDKHHAGQIRHRCDDLVAMSGLAESGLGLAFLPDDQQRPELQRLFTFEPGKTSKLWLLTHPDLRSVTRIKLVMKYLARAFSKEPVFLSGW